MRVSRHLGMLCLGWLLSTAVWAGDYAREDRLTADVEAGLVIGEPVYLSDGQRSFFSILTEADDPIPDTAVLLLHGRGMHADWPSVIHPLRIGLAEEGWTTFSLQLPVLGKGAQFEDYADILHTAGPRLDAAITHLKSLGYRHLHLVAHSCGAQMTMKWIEAGGGDHIESMALIGLGTVNYERVHRRMPPLDASPVPVLDIYGNLDSVSDMAARRWTLIKKAGHDASHQVIVPGADHMFAASGDLLLTQVEDWLMRRSLLGRHARRSMD